MTAFNRISKGHYRHAKTGVEVKLYYRSTAGGRDRNEWVVQEPLGGGWNWISTHNSYAEARADAVKYIESLTGRG